MAMMRMMMLVLRGWLLLYYEQICLVTPHGRDRCQQMTSRRTYLPPLACSSFTILLQKTRSPKVRQTFELQFFSIPLPPHIAVSCQDNQTPWSSWSSSPGQWGTKEAGADNRWKVISGKTLNICSNFLYY